VGEHGDGHSLGWVWRRRYAAAGTLVLLASACTGGSSDDPSASTDSGTASSQPAPVGFHASVQQQRIDVGTRRIGLELTSDHQTTAHVDGVQLLTSAFEQQPATAKDTEFAPDTTIDLVVTYGAPVCAGDATTHDAQVRVQYDVGGGEQTATLDVDARGRGLLQRLHDTACAKDRLDQAAALSYRLPFQRRQVDGSTALVGALELTRPADGGSGERVTITSLLGSVLFDFLPLAGGEPTWGRLASTQDTAVIPVEIRSSDLCTQHARSQSQQTFLFSAYVEVGGQPEYRQIVEPPRSLQVQALAMLDDVCG
jgi:hypothetical protein